MATSIRVWKVSSGIGSDLNSRIVRCLSWTSMVSFIKLLFHVFTFRYPQILNLARLLFDRRVTEKVNASAN